jgi:peptidoglycan/LPS O-acetylase OafA/YrhL
MACPPTPPPTIAAAGYRPHLDGLRALAVYLVVLFHGGNTRFAGGFVGVDVFFVLSGYLVTQLLWRDIETLDGIRLARFYARRVRRILPAAFVALTGTALLYVAIASPSQVAAALGAFKAAFLFVANWFFIARSTAYFGGDLAQNPVLHCWSLAVEEQFYLAWPLVLGGLVAVGRWRGAPPLRLLRVAVAGGAIASLLLALALRTGDPEHAYYGTDARAYQLLAGALLALTPGVSAALARAPRLARLLAALSVAGLVGLACSRVALDPITRGAAVTAATWVAIAALEAAPGGLARRLLSSPPVAYLGRISYGTYLWHWPVVLVLIVMASLEGPALVLLTAVIASALASLSFQLLEQPIRQWPLLEARSRTVIAAGLCASVAAAFALTPAIVDPAAASLRTVRSAGTPIPGSLNIAAANFLNLPRPPRCAGRAASDCTVVQGSGPHVLLIGDSHARMFMPTFQAIARHENLTLSVVAYGGCPWQRHLYGRPDDPSCRALKEDAYTRIIPELKPDLIVAVNLGYDDPHMHGIWIAGEDGRRFLSDTPQFTRLWHDATLASAAELEPMATEGLVIIEPIPIAPPKENPTACLVHARFLEDCRYLASVEPTRLERLYRELDAANPRIWSADFDRLVCPWWPVCDPVVSDRIVKVDAHHLTADFAAYIAGGVGDYLHANHLLPAPAAPGDGVVASGHP